MRHVLFSTFPAIVLTCLSLLVVAAVAQQDTGGAADDGRSADELFQAHLGEWKSVLKEMRELQVRFFTAEAEEGAEIRRRWQDLESQGEELIPRLREAGVKAYAAAPGVDRDLERFLLKILEDEINLDSYESAAALSQAMLDAGCDVKILLDAAGVSAFVTNDYDKAEEYLQRAQSEGVMSEQGMNFLTLIPEYRTFWEEEQQLRQQEAEQDDLPRVRITTNRGEIVAELFENEAPDTVGNFISLVEKDFYDGLTFHRVLPGFMAQAGCPIGNGSGGPGYTIYCECHKPDHRKHFRGSLSMAKQPQRDTGGSQFFLTFVPIAHLNGQHTVFGRVLEGLDVLAKIRRIDPEGEDQPQPDEIIKMEVIRKRPDREYKPNKVQQ